MKEMTTKVTYQEHLLSTVLQHWCDQYKAKDGEEIIEAGWIAVDPSKNKVVFKLITREI